MADTGLPHEMRVQAVRPRAGRRGLQAIITGWFRDRRNRAIVAALDDEQLRDAGIDLSAAGRGRAVAIEPMAAVTLAGMRDLR